VSTATRQHRATKCRKTALLRHGNATGKVDQAGG
jgi:hypothetical protein